MHDGGECPTGIGDVIADHEIATASPAGRRPRGWSAVLVVAALRTALIVARGRRAHVVEVVARASTAAREHETEPCKP
jgi:hypothetical protein